MMSVSDADVIASNPIGTHLDGFRLKLKQRCNVLGISEVRRLTVSDAKGLALELIVALQSIPLAHALTSRDGSGTLLRDLFKLGLQIDKGEFNLESIVPLLEKVQSHSSDLEVCNALFALIATPATPPQSSAPFAPPFNQTPWKFGTGSLTETSDLRRNVDPILKAEVDGNLIIDHPRFFDAFFGRVTQLSEVATSVFEMCNNAEPPLYTEHAGWTEWPNDCEESQVLNWLRRHINQFLLSAENRGFYPSKRRRCITTPNKPISGSISKRKLDVGLAYDSSNEGEESDRLPCDWSHILVPGELKSNPQEDNHSSTRFDILRYAREVFGAQDTRRFVLGFTLCGSFMRIWEFDRLGGVSSESFDIHKNGQMLVSAILGFLWMSEEDLGFDPTIVRAANNRYIEIRRNEKVERFYLEKVIKRQCSVIGRATTCWEASLNGDKQVVIKDSWEYEERPQEGLLLKEATEARAENVVQYYYHEDVHVGDAVDDIRDNVRNGLKENDGRNPFRQRRPENSKDVMSSTTYDSSGPGMCRSSTSRTITRKRSSSSIPAPMPPPKRSRLDFSVKADAERPRNRVHRRLIVRDVGKNLYDAGSLRAMLTGLLGGIKGHESLLDLKILQRDVSAGNIMLNRAEDDGFLIDLDLAVKIDREKASGAPSKTGTKVFMAIGALYGDEEHSFMHDLESFFWVLFWIGAHWNGAGAKRSKTEYESWNYKDTKELAEIKTGKVLREAKFNTEVNNAFTPYCKPLIPCIQALRKVVFPDGKNWERRDGEDKELYSRMKAVLEKASNDL